VSEGRHGASCVDVRFSRAYPAGAGESAGGAEPPGGGELALEDYARALTRADEAGALRSPDGSLVGVHLCAPAAPPGEAAREDLEAFAANLAARPGSGLGWS
jgi:hypothetical protein